MHKMKLGDSDKPAIGGPSRTKQVQILSTGPESAARRTVQRRERGDLLCGDAQYRLLDGNRRL